MIGPALYSLVYALCGKASFGILSLIILFVAGFVLLQAGKPHFRRVQHEEINE